MKGVLKVKEESENLNTSILDNENAIFQNRVVKRLGLLRQKLSVTRSDKKNVQAEDRHRMFPF